MPSVLWKKSCFRTEPVLSKSHCVIFRNGSWLNTFRINTELFIHICISFIAPVCTPPQSHGSPALFLLLPKFSEQGNIDGQGSLPAEH